MLTNENMTRLHIYLTKKNKTILKKQALDKGLNYSSYITYLILTINEKNKRRKSRF